jgi:hypothetical protein
MKHGIGFVIAKAGNSLFAFIGRQFMESLS